MQTVRCEDCGEVQQAGYARMLSARTVGSWTLTQMKT